MPHSTVWSSFSDGADGALSTRLTSILWMLRTVPSVSTYSEASLYKTLAPSTGARLCWASWSFVYTPEHGSWLNLAEYDFSVL